jgi:magnesium transporter
MYKKLTWIDLESPTKEEVESIQESLDLPSLVAEELRLPLFRSKVDRYDRFIYVVLHFPSFSKKLNKTIEQEVDFIIGKDFVLTAHYEPVTALEEFSKLFEINSTLDRGIQLDHAGFLFYNIILELYRSLEGQLESMNESIHTIERHIFEGKESEMVSSISSLNRMLVDFKQAVRFHNETLLSLEKVGTEFFGQPFNYNLNVLSGEYRKIQKTIEDQKEVMRDLRETNDSLLTAKTNDIITKLTIMNFIMLPLSLIAEVFAIHSQVYFVQTLTDFLFVITAMGLTGLVMIIYFKTKKWL